MAGFTDAREEVTLLAMLADATNTQLELLSADRHLTHIDEQSAGWAAGVRLICDVDDTLFASINEPVYPGGARYPGALAFVARCGQTRGRPVTILTARPEGQGGVLEDRLRRELDARGVAAATVLSGRALWLLGHEAMAAGKAINLAHLMALHPVDSFVLVGDSGQGDVALARQALDAWPTRIVAVFIHLVNPSLTTLKSGELDHPDSRIVFFGTYVEAARKALSLGLMSQSDVAAVGAEARSELAGIAFDTPAQAVAAQTAMKIALSSATIRS